MATRGVRSEPLNSVPLLHDVLVAVARSKLTDREIMHKAGVATTTLWRLRNGAACNVTSLIAIVHVVGFELALRRRK